MTKGELKQEAEYNEYILEKEFADKHAEYNFPKVEESK